MVGLAQAASANCGLSGDKLNATLTEQNRHHSAALGSMELDLLPGGRLTHYIYTELCLFAYWSRYVSSTDIIGKKIVFSL